MLNNGQTVVRNLVLPLPPLSEQQAIATALMEHLFMHRKATSTAHREITLLREYRTRLIADVVTGKLDVRAAAAALPDLPPDDPGDSFDDLDDLDTPDDPDTLDEEDDE